MAWLTALLAASLVLSVVTLVLQLRLLRRLPAPSPRSDTSAPSREVAKRSDGAARVIYLTEERERKLADRMEREDG